MTYRIYVACLASYNNGVHHGQWFDIEDYADADELSAAIHKEVLQTSRYPNVLVTVDCPTCDGSGSLSGKAYGTTCPDCHGKGTKEVPSAEEYAIHDYEGIEGFGEYASLSEIFEYVKLIEEHGDAWKAFMYLFGDDVTSSNFEDAYIGKYESGADFAEEFTIEMGALTGNESFFSWIDWERAWNSDLRHNYSFHDGYVFRSDW